MQNAVYISSISVEGLHDQFDIDLGFAPGLNILYGKNGRGKTTILHLLANALELDFKRFRFLRFNRILIATSGGDTVRFEKDDSTALPQVYINESLTSFSEKNPSLSDAEASQLLDIFGGRPTYLPAFRSVLERSKSDIPPYYRQAERKDQEYEDIFEREYNSLKSNLYSRAPTSEFENRQLRDEAATTAQKTSQCRQWFGPFVPVIRYPSVADVDDALTEEWRNAQIEVTRKEQRMLEEIFVKVFKTIAVKDRPPEIEATDNLLDSISELLKDQESQLSSSESGNIFQSIKEAVSSIDASVPTTRGIDRSLLEIYRQVLVERNSTRKHAFQRSRDFEQSINKFMDKKSLRIGPPAQPRARGRSAVSVATDGGHSYGLSALSSGERQILTMLYSASRTRFLSGIFLIDEPELSLHIDWQRIVLSELQNQSQGRQIIACTHSPEVGADHFYSIQDFEPRPAAKRQGSLFSDEEV